MALISLKCPQCGASIQLDNTREIGYCLYCGNKVVLQEGLKREITIDESHKVDGWIALGYDNLRARNFLGAEQYANKVIEVDYKNPGAWYIKGCCSTNLQLSMENWNRALTFAEKGTPVRNWIIEALINPKGYMQSRLKTVTVVRGRALAASGRHFHISLNGIEMAAVGNGETQRFEVEEGSYILAGKIASYKITLPLEVKKDMMVSISLNGRENKWDVVAA
jgi:hypothetical protein